MLKNIFVDAREWRRREYCRHGERGERQEEGNEKGMAGYGAEASYTGNAQVSGGTLGGEITR